MAFITTKSDFNGLLEVQCKHKRYGSIPFLKDCDLVAAVSHALGKQAAAIKQKSTHEIHPSSPQAATCTLDEKLVQVSSYINNRLHKQAKDLVSHYKNNPHEYSTLNLEQLLPKLDPTLLAFIQRITRSVRASKQNFQCNDSNITPKVIRQVYAMCVLFTTSRSCSMPLHVLLTDTILCHGGSLELVRIMNRVGAVTSIDTASRLATSVVSTRISRGVKRELIPNRLSVVSIDNIDVLQVHAMVCSTDATRKLAWGINAVCTTLTTVNPTNRNKQTT